MYVPKMSRYPCEGFCSQGTMRVNGNHPSSTNRSSIARSKDLLRPLGIYSKIFIRSHYNELS